MTADVAEKRLKLTWIACAKNPSTHSTASFKVRLSAFRGNKTRPALPWQLLSRYNGNIHVIIIFWCTLPRICRPWRLSGKTGKNWVLDNSPPLRRRFRPPIPDPRHLPPLLPWSSETADTVGKIPLLPPLFWFLLTESKHREDRKWLRVCTLYRTIVFSFSVAALNFGSTKIPPKIWKVRNLSIREKKGIIWTLLQALGWWYYKHRYWQLALSSLLHENCLCFSCHRIN